MCVYETVVSEKACGICSDALQANLDDSLLPAWMPLSDYCWENVFSPSVTPSLARFQRLSRDEQLLKLVYFYYTNRPALAWDRKKPVYWPDEPMQVLQSKTFSSFLFNQGSSALVILKTTLFFFFRNSSAGSRHGTCSQPNLWKFQWSHGGLHKQALSLRMTLGWEMHLIISFLWLSLSVVIILPNSAQMFHLNRLSICLSH